MIKIAEIIDQISAVFTLLFAVEVGAKLFAYFPLRYFSDGFNSFDLIVVLASLLRFILGTSESPGQPLS